MEKKYTLQDLAALLAERESLPLEQAEDFVRSFFELTEEGLLKDSFVKVTGFGTFKLVEVSERESVNINTGERFQISGHNKISFTPDGTLRELVNRPFAHFTTVTLNDETPEAALEEAERPLAEESTESSATSSHTPQPTAEIPVASSTSCEPNTTAPVEEEQQPDVAAEKAEENVVPAVEATTFAPTSAHVTVTTEAPTPEVSAEQAHEEVENHQSVSTAPAATSTSSLLLRPTPAPISTAPYSFLKLRRPYSTTSNSLICSPTPPMIRPQRQKTATRKKAMCPLFPTTPKRKPTKSALKRMKCTKHT